MTWKKKQGGSAGQDPQAEAGAAARFDLGKYKKHLKWAIPLAVVVVLVIAIAVRQAGQAQTTEVAPEYTQTSVTRRTIAQTLSTTGTLKAANSYTVRTLVEGEILAADFEEGQEVAAGQHLYQIENSDASTSVEQAQINLDQAQRNYDTIADYRYVRSPVAGTVYTLSVKVGGRGHLRPGGGRGAGRQPDGPAADLPLGGRRHLPGGAERPDHPGRHL